MYDFHVMAEIIVYKQCCAMQESVFCVYVMQTSKNSRNDVKVMAQTSSVQHAVFYFHVLLWMGKCR